MATDLMHKGGGLEEKIQTATKIIARISLEGIGYLMVASVITGYAGWTSLKVFLFDSGAMFENQALAVLGVGAILIFVGEFLSNYVRSLNYQTEFQRAILLHAENTATHIQQLTNKMDKLTLTLDRVVNKKAPPFGMRNERP